MELPITTALGAAVIGVGSVVVVGRSARRALAALERGRERWGTTPSPEPHGAGPYRADAIALPRGVPWSVRVAGFVWALVGPVEPLVIGAVGGGTLIAALSEMHDEARGGPLAAVVALAFLVSAFRRRTADAAVRLLSCEAEAWRDARREGAVGVVRHGVPLGAHVLLVGPTDSTAVALALYGSLLLATAALWVAARRVREVQSSAPPAALEAPSTTLPPPAGPSVQWTPGRVRATGGALVLAAFVLVGIQLERFAEDGRYWPALFPLACMLFPLGVVKVITGRRAERLEDAPRWYRALILAIVAAGCAAGLAANHAVFGSAL